MMDRVTLQMEERLQYPKCVYFIIGAVFCERFCYYGLRTVLSLYLVDILSFNENKATMLYHSFSGLSYVFPLVGAIIADSYIGKFKTILYLSIAYIAGNILLSITAVSYFQLPQRGLSFLSLFLIALGGGGIKPCISAFGGDQFILPEQENHLNQFFSLYYLAINWGSMLSTFITPIVRNDVHCFGENSCFPFAFGIPASLLFVAMWLFLMGNRLYIKKEPSGNIILEVLRCIGRALKFKCKQNKLSVVKKNHWLDYGSDKYKPAMIQDVKIVVRILLLFVPLPIFWALFDQDGSKWTFQAVRMNGRIPGTSLTIKPDHMQLSNPLLIVALIPLFHHSVYPFISRLGINTPLRKIATGGLLASLAFVVSALVEFQIQASIQMKNDSYEKDIIGKNNIFNMKLEPHKMDDKISPENINHLYHIVSKSTSPASLNINRTTSLSSLFTTRSEKLNPTNASFIETVTDKRMFARLVKQMSKSKLNDTTFTTHFESLNPTNASSIETFTDNTMFTNVSKSNTDNTTYEESIQSINEKEEALTKSDLNMLWLLPQYLIITVAEVMFSITGLEFAFTQAPSNMKSVMSACWSLTIALGNMMVVLVEKTQFFDNPAHEFIFFAALMAFDMLIFILLAVKYEYASSNEILLQQEEPPFKESTS